MNYFKVVEDGKVIDVGFTFLKWNEKRNRFFLCSIEEAQFAQGLHDDVYHAYWFRKAPAAAGTYPEHDIVMINDVEFDELKALLDDGEVIEEPDIPAPVQPEPVIPSDEKPMTVAEMRQTILAQQEQIDILTECILEMSELVYNV